jgi:molybdate transport system substrate-binding protein
MRRLLAALALAAAGAAAAGSALPRPPPPRRILAIAAAANLKIVMEELKRAFVAAQPGAEVTVTTGASGAFFAQIRSGAPFDLFFSADREYPRKVVEEGLGGPEVVYAVGKLVVWTPKESAIDLEKAGLRALADPAVKKIAIANPAIAPYGRAAIAALEADGVLAAVKDRLVFGQSVSQAAQFAQSGAADAALIAASLTFSPELMGGNVHFIPARSYPPLEQSAVILKGAADPALAKAFLDLVTGADGRKILLRSGYGLPGGA